MGNEMDELLAQFITLATRPDIDEWKSKVRALYDKEFQTACEAQYQLGLAEVRIDELVASATQWEPQWTSNAAANAAGYNEALDRFKAEIAQLEANWVKDNNALVDALLREKRASERGVAETERAEKNFKAAESWQEQCLEQQERADDAEEENARLNERITELQRAHTPLYESFIVARHELNRLREVLEKSACHGCMTGGSDCICEIREKALSRQESQFCRHGNSGACNPCKVGCICPGTEQNLKVRAHFSECPSLSTTPVQDNPLWSDAKAPCPKCGDRLIHNRTGTECSATHCDYNTKQAGEDTP